MGLTDINGKVISNEAIFENSYILINNKYLKKKIT